jgi:hypothetical protein
MGNLAITCAMEKKLEAFQHLQEAVKLGFADAGRLSADDDLKSLRTDARFQALLAEIQKTQSAAPSNQIKDHSS